MKQLITLLSISFFCIQTLFSQAPTLRGTVANSNGEPILGAKVMLANEQHQEAILSNEKGGFRFVTTPSGKYTLTIIAAGFGEHSEEIEITPIPQKLAPIKLTTAFDMDEIAIEKQVNPAMVKGDTTEYSAAAFKTNPDATAEDLIRKLPGVTVEGGTVKSAGENVQQVLVDGKVFFGNDPSAALKNLPAEIIDKIQVFDQQSDQSQFTGIDDGQTTKTVNIVTRMNMRNGEFGKFYGGMGDEGKYKGGGNYNMFNTDQRLSILGQSNNINQQNFSSEDLLGITSSSGGRGRRGGGRSGGGRSGRGGGSRGGSASDFLVGQQQGISNTTAFGLNYSDEIGKKLKISGSYFFNQTDNSSIQELTQLYILDRDSGQVYRENSDTESTDINHRFNARIEYKFSDRTTLLIRPRFTMQFNEGTENTEGRSRLGDTPLNRSVIKFGSDLKALDVNSFFLVRHRFEKRGRTLSLMARTGYKSNEGDNQLLSGLKYFSEPFSLDTINQVSALNSNNWNIYTNLTYTEPLGKLGMMQFSYSYSPQWNDSETLTNNYNESSRTYNRLDSLLSNSFTNTYSAHQIGPGIMIRKSRTFMLSARVNGQFAQLNTDQVFPFATTFDRNFVSVLPSLYLRHEISKQKNLRLIYRTSTNPPSMTQLQEVLDNSNPLQLSIGNPELKQSYAHSLMFRYNQTNTSTGSLFYFMLNGNLTQNYIGNRTIIPNRNIVYNNISVQRGTQLTVPENLDGNWSLRSFITYGLAVPLLKSNLNINLSGDYSRRPSLINDLSNETLTANGGIGLTLASNFSENIDFTISSQSNINRATNSIQENQNNRYFNQSSYAKLNLIFLGGFVFRSQLNHQLYRGLSDDFDQDFWLWSSSLGRKFLKDRRGELMINVFDLLRQNTSVQRNVNDFYIEDLSTIVLQRYLMLTFTYNLRKFKAGEIKQDEGRRGWGGPPPRN